MLYICFKSVDCSVKYLNLVALYLKSLNKSRLCSVFEIFTILSSENFLVFFLIHIFVSSALTFDIFKYKINKPLKQNSYKPNTATELYKVLIFLKMSKFQDIQKAKQDIKNLIEKRKELVAQYYEKYIKPEDSHKEGLTIDEFNDFFKIKNLQQLPNFKSFQNSSDTELVTWALKRNKKIHNNNTSNPNSSTENILADTSNAKDDKANKTAESMDNIEFKDKSEIVTSTQSNGDETGKKRTLEESQEISDMNNDKLKLQRKSETPNLSKKLNIKRSAKYANEPTNIVLKDDYLDYLRNLNTNNTEIQKQKHKTVNSFYRNEAHDNKKTVFLTMDPSVPTSIPNSKPLYEIVYLQNTLPLKKLLCSSEKVLTTDIWERTLQENKQAIVSNRIEDLKRSGKWSLRQEKVFKDPISELFNKPTLTKSIKKTTRQVMLEDSQLMAVDFREYSKWKMAMKVMLSQAVMDYFILGKEICCVKVKSADHSKDDNEIVVLDKNDDVQMLKVDVGDPLVQKVISEETKDYKTYFKFSLAIDEDDLSKVEKAIIESLPTNEYNKTKNSILTSAEIKEKKQLLEELLEDELDYIPASRIMYPREKKNYVKIAQRDFVDLEMSTDAMTKKRGLFGSNSGSVNNQRKVSLKPPTPPNLECIKHRMPVFWLPKDDEMLVSLINEYRYNWDIIASHMNNKTTFGFQSSVMKRTPWTCFERFLQLNEKFDLSELKGYRASLALAWLNHQNQIMDTVGNGKTSMKPIGLTENSKQRGHRSLLWASIFDGMKKVIVQRENKKYQASQNRQKANQLAAQAKTNAEAQKKAKDATLAAQATLSQGTAINTTSTLPTPYDMVMLKNKNQEEIKKQYELKKLQAKQKLYEEQQQQKLKLQKQQQLHQKSTVKHKISPRELIETYAAKMMNARPDVTKEQALKAAEGYYKNLLHQQQLKLQNQKQLEASQGSEKKEEDNK